MKTAFDADPSGLTQDHSAFLANVRENGWAGSHYSAEGNALPYSYTTGFQSTLGVAEIIVFGLPQEAAHTILWDIFQQQQAGLRIVPGYAYSQFLESMTVVFQPVAAKFYEQMAWSQWFYGGDGFDCWQVVWPDQGGRFPWQPGFDATYEALQPDLSDGKWAGMGR